MISLYDLFNLIEPSNSVIIIHRDGLKYLDPAQICEYIDEYTNKECTQLVSCFSALETNKLLVHLHY